MRNRADMNNTNKGRTLDFTSYRDIWDGHGVFISYHVQHIEHFLEQTPPAPVAYPGVIFPQWYILQLIDIRLWFVEPFIRDETALKRERSEKERLSIRKKRVRRWGRERVRERESEYKEEKSERKSERETLRERERESEWTKPSLALVAAGFTDLSHISCSIENATHSVFIVLNLILCSWGYCEVGEI